MFNKFRRVLKNHKGFTLVELMVVVVIIGILVAIAVPVYSSSTKTAERRAVEANLRTIDSAIMQFQVANDGTSPTDISLQLVGTDKFLAAKPAGPGTTTNYSIDSTTHRATVTSTASVGGKVLASESLPIIWP